MQTVCGNFSRVQAELICWCENLLSSFLPQMTHSKISMASRNWTKAIKGINSTEMKMNRKDQRKIVAVKKTGIEQARTRAELAKTLKEQARTRTELVKTRKEQAKTRTELAKTLKEQAKTRAVLAKTRDG